MKTQKTRCNKGEALTVAVRKLFKQHFLLFFFVDNKYFNKVYVYICVYIYTVDMTVLMLFLRNRWSLLRTEVNVFSSQSPSSWRPRYID